MNPTIANAVYAVGRNSVSGVQLLGTCFAVTQELVATTAHVSGPSDNDLCIVLAQIKNLNEYQDTTLTNVTHISAKLVKYDPIRDIAIIAPQGVNITFPYTIASSDNTNTGSIVSTIGFPHADHGRLVLTEQRSSVGARVILGSQGIKTKHIILNVQARPGQSGSPVLTEDGSKVVAMMIGSYAPGGGGGISLGGIDPHTLHQTTHALSAEYITELLK